MHSYEGRAAAVKAAIVGCTLALLFACSDGSDNHRDSLSQPSGPFAVAEATVSLPPSVGAPLDFGIIELASVGYIEQEYFLSGTASAFTNLNELTREGTWQAEPAEPADYTTRVLVRRPIDAADFNGTVLVEWFNVTSGFDSNPGWSNAQAEILRQGYAWVGVSAQFVGVYGREGALVPFNLKSYDPERYAALEHPGDSFSFDIFSQVAQAVRHPGALDLLDGLEAGRIIATGQSQSASRLVTYVNAIQPRYQAYDGFLIHSRSAYAAPLAEGPQVLIESPEDPLIRTDLSVPVLVLQAENDVLSSSVRVRQDDSDLLRVWEVAGTAHSDLYSTQTGWQDDGADPSAAAVEEVDNIQGFIQCDGPVNSGPMHYAYAAALDGMNRWIMGQDAPANGEPLQLNDDLSGFLLDDTGNALGGIRTPFVDAPVALLSGQGQSNQSFCALFGTTRLLPSEQLVSVYVDESGYLAAVSQATDSAVAAGYLLPADGELIIAWATEQWRILMARDVVSIPEAGFLYNFRYCEVLLVTLSTDQIRADVYNSMGLNSCPQAQWEALDAAEIAGQYGVSQALLNGPRFWVLDSIINNGAQGGLRAETEFFGDIEMRLAATVILPPGVGTGDAAYSASRVSRDTVFQYVAGRQVYELRSPEGERYMMQSFSRIADKALRLEDLPGLGDRLDLPPGWTFSVRTLDAPFDLLTVDGIAEVVTDNLANTYQRIP